MRSIIIIIIIVPLHRVTNTATVPLLPVAETMSTILSQRNNGTIDSHNTYVQASANLLSAYQMTPQRANQANGRNGQSNNPTLANGEQWTSPLQSYPDDDVVQLRTEEINRSNVMPISQVVQQMDMANEATNSQSAVDQPSPNLWTALYDYEAQNEDELSLTRGMVVIVLSEDSAISGDEGWWTGKVGDKVGIFPCNYVTDGDGMHPIEVDEKDLTLMEIVGQGGFNEVRRGIWRGEEVAIKTPHKSDNPEKAQENVLKEAKLSWTLSHVNIVRLYGVCLKSDFRLVMEYARGGTLNQILAEHKIPPDVLVGWAIQIADGMNYLHNGAPISIIHRDLKSANSKLLSIYNFISFEN